MSYLHCLTYYIGKSTVLALLERFYDIESGNISIDGTPLRDIDPRWLHKALAIVPQEPVLFSGTIRSNILYSRLVMGDEISRLLGMPHSEIVDERNEIINSPELNSLVRM